jgi:hypothetical protein
VSILPLGVNLDDIAIGVENVDLRKSGLASRVDAHRAGIVCGWLGIPLVAFSVSSGFQKSNRRNSAHGSQKCESWESIALPNRKVGCSPVVATIK